MANLLHNSPVKNSLFNTQLSSFKEKAIKFYRSLPKILPRPARDLTPPTLTGEEKLYIQWLKYSEAELQPIASAEDSDIFHSTVIGQYRLDYGYIQYIKLLYAKKWKDNIANEFEDDEYEDDELAFMLTKIYLVDFFNKKKYLQVDCSLKHYFFVDITKGMN